MTMAMHHQVHNRGSTQRRVQASQAVDAHLARHAQGRVLVYRDHDHVLVVWCHDIVPECKTTEMQLLSMYVNYSQMFFKTNISLSFLIDNDHHITGLLPIPSQPTFMLSFSILARSCHDSCVYSYNWMEDTQTLVCGWTWYYAHLACIC
jgi:hypothetical protein